MRELTEETIECKIIAREYTQLLKRLITLGISTGLSSRSILNIANIKANDSVLSIIEILDWWIDCGEMQLYPSFLLSDLSNHAV